MKLLSAMTAKGARLAAKLPSGVLIFSHATDLFPEQVRSIPFTLHAALSAKGGLKRLLPHLQAAAAHPDAHKFLASENEIKVARPFLPNNVICVGLNYREHAKEGNMPIPEKPVLFAKWTGAISGPGDAIVLPRDSSEVDYEAELAVVIGQKCKNVTADRALDYVAGYTCMNDVSARDYQRSDSQWSRAKSQDTFGPFGPYLVTTDEIPDPQGLNIRCFLNGDKMQDSNTQDMIFSVREIIAYLSRGMTLEPGDVISTGTPQGVGFARKPPIFLKPGDQVEVEIERIGRLANPVTAS
jgi:2-keto-4-pentenoate hydratase/2-oxohepta-3-ene-1,7-dioic acid hydratase in catechol pathway